MLRKRRSRERRASVTPPPLIFAVDGTGAHFCSSSPDKAAQDGRFVVSVVAQSDPGPMVRFEAVCADAAAPSLVFQLLTDGKRLPEIAKEWRVPKGRFIEWFCTKHEELYDAALKVRAAELAMDALDASLAATPEDVAVQKLRADVALKLAAKFDRARYGETVKVERDLRVIADAGLLGTMGDILQLVAKRKPLVLEQARAPAVDAELII